MNKNTIIGILILLLVITLIASGLRINKLGFERDLYFNRMFDIRNQHNVELFQCLEDKELWENRATDNLKLVKSWCEELTTQYKYIVHNLDDCTIFQADNVANQQIICEREPMVFAVER